MVQILQDLCYLVCSIVLSRFFAFHLFILVLDLSGYIHHHTLTSLLLCDEKIGDWSIVQIGYFTCDKSWKVGIFSASLADASIFTLKVLSASK